MESLKSMLALLLVLASGMAGCAFLSQEKSMAADTESSIPIIPDARAAASQMSQSLLSGAWLSDFYQTSRRSPVLMLGTFSGTPAWEQELDFFIKNMTWQLLQSQQLRIVCYREGSEAVQARDNEPLSAEAQKMGADFLLTSSLTEEQTGLMRIELQVMNLEGTQLMQLSTEFLPALTSEDELL